MTRNLPSTLAILLAALCLPSGALAGDTTHGQPLSADQLEVSASSRAMGTEPGHMIGKTLWKSWTSALDDNRPSITVTFRQRRYISAIAIRPGDLRNGSSYKASRRPEKLEIRWGGQRTTVTVPDTPKLHVLPLPQLVGADKLQIRFLRAYGPLGRGIAVAQLVVYEPHDVLVIRPDLRVRIEAAAKRLKRARSKADRKRFGQELAAFGTPAVPWLTTMTSQLTGPGLRIALDALARIDTRQAKRAIMDVIGKPPMSRRNIGVEVANAHSIVIPRFRLVSLLMRDQRSRMAAALAPLCREKVKYVLKAVRRAAERRSKVMLQAVPACLTHYLQEGPIIAKEMLASQHPVVVKAGLRTYAALAAAAPAKLGTVAVEAITGFVHSSNARVRSTAAASLARIGTSDAANELLKLAMGVERRASRSAIVALASMNPLPVSALREVLTRGPAYDAGPMIERLIRRKSDAARELLLQAISLASYMTWWDAAVAGFIGHGKPAFEIAARWMHKHPRRSHNLVTAFKKYARKTAPHFKELAQKLPSAPLYDNLRMGVVGILAKGQPKGWVPVLHKVAMNSKLSYRARVAALNGLSWAEPGDPKALTAARAAMKADDETIADAGRRTAAKLGDKKAAKKAVAVLRKTPSTSWRSAWVETLAAFPELDADYLLISRFPGARDAVQSRILEVLIQGRRIAGVAHVMQVAITNNHPLRLKALTLLGYER